MRIACILVTVGALSACGRGNCVFNASCAQGELCTNGQCATPNTTSCDGNTVTETDGESVDCTKFNDICGLDGDIDWCVRPTGDDACKHVYEECGKRFATATGPVNEANCSVLIVASFKPCKLGCFATSPCDQASIDACFNAQETCALAPPPPH